MIKSLLNFDREFRFRGAEIKKAHAVFLCGPTKKKGTGERHEPKKHVKRKFW